MGKVKAKKVITLSIIFSLLFSIYPLIGNGINAQENVVDENIVQSIEEETSLKEELSLIKEEPVVNSILPMAEEEATMVPLTTVPGTVTSITIPTGGKLIIRDNNQFDLVDSLGNITPSPDVFTNTTVVRGDNVTITLNNATEAAVGNINITNDLTFIGNGTLKCTNGIETSGKLSVMSGFVDVYKNSILDWITPIETNSISVTGGTLKAWGGGRGPSAATDLIVSGPNSAMIYYTDLYKDNDATGGIYGKKIVVENGALMKVDGATSTTTRELGVGAAVQGRDIIVESGGRIEIGLENPGGVNTGILVPFNTDGNLEVRGVGSRIDIKSDAPVNGNGVGSPSNTEGINANRIIVDDNAKINVESRWYGIVTDREIQVLNGARLDVKASEMFAVLVNMSGGPTPTINDPGLIIDGGTLVTMHTGKSLAHTASTMSQIGDIIVRNGGVLEGYYEDNGLTEDKTATGVRAADGKLIVDNGTVVGDVSNLTQGNGVILSGVFAKRGMEVTNGGTVTGSGVHSGVRAHYIDVSEDSVVTGTGTQSGIYTQSYGVPGTPGISATDDATIIGNGNSYGIQVKDGTIASAGNANITGTGAIDVAGAGIIAMDIDSQGGKLTGFSQLEGNMGIHATNNIVIDNKGILEGHTPSFNDVNDNPAARSVAGSYSAVKADGTITADGEGQVIENYGCADDFTDTFFKPCARNLNMSSYSNYTWAVGAGALDVDATAGIRTLTEATGTTSLTASRMNGTGEAIQLTGNSKHQINYFATLKGAFTPGPGPNPGPVIPPSKAGGGTTTIQKRVPKTGETAIFLAAGITLLAGLTLLIASNKKRNK